MKYFKELDGIRAIAALMIMFCHFFQILNNKTGEFFYLNKLANIGGTGVSLFFVLSGFLITRLLLKSKINKNYFLNFYARRALRIFPLYYLFLTIYYFVFPYCFNEKITPLKDQIFYWTYLQNFAMTFHWGGGWLGPVHFWSLAVEEHFYLIWPIVILITKINRLTKIIYIILGIAIILRAVFLFNNIEVFYFTFTRFDELALGGLLAILEYRNLLGKIQPIYFLKLFLLTMIPTVILWTLYSGLENKWVQLVKFNLMSLSYFFVIGFVMMLKENNKIKEILKGQFLMYSGKISYGLYVFHPLCFWVYNRSFHFGLVIDIILSFAFTYIIAHLSFKYFESYFLRLKKTFN